MSQLPKLVIDTETKTYTLDGQPLKGCTGISIEKKRLQSRNRFP